MEILINELSLDGQFSSVDCFIESGLMPFLKILNEMNPQSDFLYKKNNFWESKITAHDTIYDIYTGNISRLRDEIRRFKSQLAKLFDNPYWENNPKQIPDYVYLYNGNTISNSSLSEACERDKVVTSFWHNNFLSKQLSVYKDNHEIKIDNLLEYGDFTRVAYNRKYMTFDEYCRKIFSKSKLNFSEIDRKDGFSLVRREEENLFFDGFRKFSELSWQQILVDDALEYKEFNNKNHFQNVGEKIFKFRISQKYRCFGYAKNGIFFVLKFDLAHKLSDLG